MGPSCRPVTPTQASAAARGRCLRGARSGPPAGVECLTLTGGGAVSRTNRSLPRSPRRLPRWVQGAGAVSGAATGRRPPEQLVTHRIRGGTERQRWRGLRPRQCAPTVGGPAAIDVAARSDRRPRTPRSAPTNGRVARAGRWKDRGSIRDAYAGLTPVTRVRVELLLVSSPVSHDRGTRALVRVAPTSRCLSAPTSPSA